MFKTSRFNRNSWKNFEKTLYQHFNRNVTFYFLAFFSLINCSNHGSIANCRIGKMNDFFPLPVPSFSNDREYGVKFVNIRLITFASFPVYRVHLRFPGKLAGTGGRKVFCLQCSKLKCQRGRWNLSSSSLRSSVGSLFTTFNRPPTFFPIFSYEELQLFYSRSYPRFSLL